MPQESAVELNLTVTCSLNTRSHRNLRANQTGESCRTLFIGSGAWAAEKFLDCVLKEGVGVSVEAGKSGARTSVVRSPRSVAVTSLPPARGWAGARPARGRHHRE